MTGQGQGSSRSGPRRLLHPGGWAWWAGAATAVATYVGASWRVGPRVTDEVGYLVNARVLVGGPPAELSCCTVYSGGYSLLLMPVALRWRDPEAFYAGALVVNAVLVGLVVPTGYLLARRVSACSPAAATAAGVAAAVGPGLQLYARYAWSEALLSVLVLGWATSWSTFAGRSGRLAVTEAADRGRWWLWALPTSSLLAGWALTTHNRTLPVVLLQAAALGVVLWRVPAARRSAAVAVGVLVAACAAGALLNAWLTDSSWPDRPANAFVGNALSNLADVDGWPTLATLAAGQLWYLGAASGAVAAAGLVVAAAMALCGRPAARVAGVLVLASTVGVTLLSTVVTGPFSDPSYWVYGRYLGMLTPTLTCLAVTVLAHRPLRGAAALVAAVTGMWVLTAPLRSVARGQTRADLSVAGLAVTWAQDRQMDAVRSATVATVVGLALAALAVALRALRARNAPTGVRSAGSSPGASVASWSAAALALAVVAFSAVSANAFAGTTQTADESARFPAGRTVADLPVLRTGQVGVAVAPPGGVGEWTMLQFWLPGRVQQRVDGVPAAGDTVMLVSPDVPGPPRWNDAGPTPDGLWRVWTR